MVTGLWLLTGWHGIHLSHDHIRIPSLWTHFRPIPQAFDGRPPSRVDLHHSRLPTGGHRSPKNKILGIEWCSCNDERCSILGYVYKKLFAPDDVSDLTTFSTVGCTLGCACLHRYRPPFNIYPRAHKHTKTVLCLFQRCCTIYAYRNCGHCLLKFGELAAVVRPPENNHLLPSTFVYIRQSASLQILLFGIHQTDGSTEQSGFKACWGRQARIRRAVHCLAILFPLRAVWSEREVPGMGLGRRPQDLRTGSHSYSFPKSGVSK